jgi:hypothetical protein
VSDAGLAAAILRDLGMTLAEFNAAGDQGKRAADAVASLSGLPGYVGISLKDGKIAVEGSGPELEAQVAELNSARQNGAGQSSAGKNGARAAARAAGGEFVLVAPARKVTAAATPAAAVSDAPTPPPTTAPTPTTPPPTTAPTPTTPAPTAPSSLELVAASTDQLFRDYVREVGAAGLQAVTYANGSYVIRTGGMNSPESGSPQARTVSLASGTAAGVTRPAAGVAPGATQPAASPKAFVARYSNVRLEEGEPLAPEEDFFGGQGYVFNTGITCSAGFAAFSPVGQPLVLTAGHCTDDGTAVSADVEGAEVPSARSLGTLGFSQFGGPNNSWITGDASNPGNVGTDIAVIESIRPGLDVQPAATRWDDPANPGATAVKIIGTAAPVPGQAVCRSGRTAGWSCGTVDEVGIYVVGGFSTDPADLRAFRGFLSNSVQSSGGDSGGPWISGNFAVGTHSAGDAPGSASNFAVATTLEDAITQIPGGVQLQLFLNKPVLTDPADRGAVAVGQTISGQVPAAPASAVAAGSKVRITVPGQQPIDVPVDAAGLWQFTAPSPAGGLHFLAETVNGFSHSGASPFDVTVLPSDLPAPEVLSPGDGAVLTAVEHIDGTGTPGATVKLSGDAAGSAVVGLDRTWTVPFSGTARFGPFTVRAAQTARGVADGPAASRTFTVVPPAPAVSNIRNGQHFAHDAIPPRITGTALNGAKVSVVVDGAAAGQADSDGSWSLPIPAGLATGAHSVSVSQSIDGVTSVPVDVTFTVDPVPVVAPAGVRTAGVASQLAATGAGSLLPAAGIGAGVLLLGGVTLVLVRRRSRR